MKTIFSFLLVTLFLNLSIAQTTVIPDANFEQVLINLGYDSGVPDGIIATASIDTVTILNTSSNNIADLTGIEDFTALTKLSCQNQNLSNLDLSQNINLSYLNCVNNQLSNLILPSSNNLRRLHCDVNQLTSIDVSQYINLNALTFSSNQITNIDISQNLQLVEFGVRDNPLGSLDLNLNNSLDSVGCEYCQLVCLKLPSSQITALYAYGNPDLLCIETTVLPFFDIIDSTCSYSAFCGNNCNIYVNDITVEGQGGVSSITTPGGTLQMEAVVLPASADDNSYTWSVSNGSASAVIDVNGVLTATADGIVTIAATANDGSGVMGTKDIAISNQSLGVHKQNNNTNLFIFPNPASHELSIIAEELIIKVEIYNLIGKVVQTETTTKFNVESLSEGVYLLKIKTKKGIVNKRLVKI